MTRTELQQQINSHKNALERNYKHFHKGSIDNVSYAKKKLKLKMEMIEFEKELKASVSEVKEPIHRERKI